MEGISFKEFIKEIKLSPLDVSNIVYSAYEEKETALRQMNLDRCHRNEKVLTEDELEFYLCTDKESHGKNLYVKFCAIEDIEILEKQYHIWDRKEVIEYIIV